MTAKTRPARRVGAQRVAQHAEAQRAKGLVRVPVWVPVADKDRLIAYAMGLRIGAELLLPSDRRTAALLRYGIDPSQESKTAPPGRARQPPATRGDDKPRRKRKRRTAAKPAKKVERTQEQNQPKTPKKKRNQRRRQAQKAARAKKKK